MAVFVAEETIHVEDNPFASSKPRSCLCFPCFGGDRRSSAVGSEWWERIRGDRWWDRGFKAFRKIREWSEIVAGPKWKTFIRRLNRNRSGQGSGSAAGQGKFQYDPLSYSLNFDEGAGHNGNLDAEEGFELYRGFSTRYAAVSEQPAIAEALGDVAAHAS